MKIVLRSAEGRRIGFPWYFDFRFEFILALNLAQAAGQFMRWESFNIACGFLICAITGLMVWGHRQSLRRMKEFRDKMVMLEKTGEVLDSERSAAFKNFHKAPFN